jgi:hypothetical protein
MKVPLPMYQVKIAAHSVAPRWVIRARTIKLPAPDAEFARGRAIRWAHADAGVPPMLPLVRASLAHTTAEPVGEVHNALHTFRRQQDEPDQLELFGRAA